MAIQELRNEVDKVYDEMLALFIRQMELRCEIGREKSKEGKPLADRKREEEILERVVANSPQDMQNYSIELFRTILNLSKQYFDDIK